MTASITILIVDDHLVFRMGLKALLASEPGFTVVGEARNGEESVAVYRELQPDVVLMDLRMPGVDGLSALVKIRAFHPIAKILMLTSFCTEEDIFRALNSGAMGYVLKDIEHAELISAIRMVHDNHRYIPERVALRLAERLPRHALTVRETEVLHLVVKGLINREIAVVLGTSVSTVKNQLNTIFTKLEVTDRTEAATTAVQRGIVQL